MDFSYFLIFRVFSKLKLGFGEGGRRQKWGAYSCPSLWQSLVKILPQRQEKVPHFCPEGCYLQIKDADPWWVQTYELMDSDEYHEAFLNDSLGKGLIVY